MRINTIILYFTSFLMHALPETRCFGIKRFLLRISGVYVGKNARICSSAHIIGNGILSIGDDTFIGPRTFIHATSTVKIGNNCDISSNVIILNGSHEVDLSSKHIAGKGNSEDVIIGDGSWICTNATLLGSTHIGEKCIVAASSTTKGNYPNLSLVKGCIAQASPLK